jgi:hypothetical protein
VVLRLSLPELTAFAHMTHKRLCARLLLGALSVACAAAQTPPLAAHSDAAYYLERWSVLTGGSTVHLSIQPFARQDAVALARRADTAAILAAPTDRRIVAYVFCDNNEWLAPTDSHRVCPSRRPFLKHFYRTLAHFLEVNTDAFRLRANPILHLSAGRQQAESAPLFVNQRGIEVRGDVDRRLFFYTDLVETQAQYAAPVNQWVQTYRSLPGAGFFKPYRSRRLDTPNAYDYNVAQAGVGFYLSPHVGVQLGHGRFFIGNGRRSLFLSDVGNVAFFLRLSTRVWKLHYQNLFVELSPISTAMPRPPNSLLPKKYAAIHYLSGKIKPNLTLGFFEAIVFNRSRQFEWQYLNPVIFYRTVEGMLGSADNVLMGLEARWDMARRISVYGQVLIDEFFTSELFGRDRQGGWWGNKYGAQLGAKYFNAFGVARLDLQIETNVVRPYTYSSFDSLNGYTHYSLPLAHPLWANFREALAVVHYQPHARWTLNARLLWAKTGEDPAGENWGANPLIGNGSRAQDYNNRIGQGIATSIRLFALSINWQWRHNLFWEIQALWRDKHSADPERVLRTRFLSVGLRWNAWYRMADF